MLGKIKNVQIGQVLKIKELEEDDRRKTVTRRFIVIAIYPYHVLCKDKFGIRRSFSYGDLLNMGFEIQNAVCDSHRRLKIEM